MVECEVNIKKKGFTLIELLAVIVILAIIMVIAIPKILNVIEDSKIKSFLLSAEGIKKSANNFIMSENLNGGLSNDYKFEFKDNVQLSNKKLNIKGNIPDSGSLVISKKRKIKLAIWSDELNLCAYKNYDENKVRINNTLNEKEICNVDSDIIKSTWLWINYNWPEEIKYVRNMTLGKELIDKLYETGINTIFLPMQLGHIEDTYTEFIKYANSKHINIYDLLGDPEFIKEENYNSAINQNMDEIVLFNKHMKEKGINAHIDGIHYDVEFYGRGNEDFGLGNWINGQSEAAKTSPRRNAYINFVKEARKYSSKVGLLVDHDVTNELSKFTYYDSTGNEKNMMEEVVNNSDSITIMYYVTMKKFITTNNELIFKGPYKFYDGVAEGEPTINVEKSTIDIIGNKKYSIGSDLSFFRQDYAKVKGCKASFVNELVPTYIDKDFVYTKEYIDNFHKLQLKNIREYQNQNNLNVDVGITYYDSLKLLDLVRYKNYVVKIELIIFKII